MSTGAVIAAGSLCWDQRRTICSQLVAMCAAGTVLATAWLCGQPVKANSIGRFAQWVEEHPEQIGTAYTRTAIGRMLGAHTVATEYLSHRLVYSEAAMRPLLPYLKDRKDELPAIAAKITQLSNGSISSSGQWHQWHLCGSERHAGGL